MKTYLACLKEIRNEPHSKMGSLKKLRAGDWVLIDEFAAQHDALDPNDRQTIINRMWVNVIDRPKNWVLIGEILQLANSRQYSYVYGNRRV